MLSADAIVSLHEQATRAWHSTAQDDIEVAGSNWLAGVPNDRSSSSGWLDRVALQHRANFDLWHIEDEARTPGASDAQIADVKRRVDQTNQLRNDLSEALDRILLYWLQIRSLPNPEAELHSESAGLIIDRLSILALKIYHTREEAERHDAPSGHLERNRSRLAILQEQHQDLASCLDSLWRQTLDGTRRFKLYRQLKMYNDPSLNPAIYLKTQK